MVTIIITSMMNTWKTNNRDEACRCKQPTIGNAAFLVS